MSQQNRSLQIPLPVVTTALWLTVGWLTASMTVRTVLESGDLSATFVSRLLWQAIVRLLGGEVRLEGQSLLMADLPFWPVAAIVAGVMALGAGMSVMLAGAPVRDSALTAARHSGGWGCAMGGWFFLWLFAIGLAWGRTVEFLESVLDLWFAVSLAGWITVSIGRGPRVEPRSQSAPLTPDLRRRGRLRWVLAGIGIYTIVYTAMNWQMYRALLIPHGDSAMYEEHLWNVLHGKGFRSYLDQGLFLGEHMQVLHLALIPLYVLWPSHLLLELCESFALALTALPVYWIARRHTQSERAAVWMAAATLLYFPLHYLDIAIDFKTFRPMALSVPILMFAIDQMERGRLATTALLLVAALCGKEDLAIVIAPLGLWWFIHAWRRSKGSGARSEMIFGASTAVVATVYLILSVKVFIPWFRGGETVHYARYFSRFGETPTEIVTNMLTQPGLLISQLLTAGTLVYGLRVVVPLGGTPLLSPSRLLVGAPLFVLLRLNEIAQETPAPVHHFHAPLVPIVLWAASAGLPQAAQKIWKVRPQDSRSQPASLPQRAGLEQPTGLAASRFACWCALLTSAVISFHPLAVKFWDPGRATYWGTLFVPGERARQFAKIESLIPRSARVASTDFVHPRFTHHERSYDYSDYLRKVAGYQHRVPDDTDYIVIDTRHPYSRIRRPEDVRELREEPQKWELLRDVWEQTDGHFIVLKRR